MDLCGPLEEILRVFRLLGLKVEVSDGVIKAVDRHGFTYFYHYYNGCVSIDYDDIVIMLESLRESTS